MSIRIMSDMFELKLNVSSNGEASSYLNREDWERPLRFLSQ